MTTAIRENLMALLLLAPFFLNDFAFIQARSAEEWLLADYASRVFALVLICSMPSFRTYAREAFPGLPGRAGAPAESAGILIFATIVCFLVFLLSERYLRDPLAAAYPDLILFQFPTITADWLRLFDLTVGLALVAISEELTFRAVLKRVIERWTAKPFAVVIVSSVLFGLIHWSAGPGTVLAATVDGAVFMTVFLMTRSIVPTIAAHYFAGLWVFL